MAGEAPQIGLLTRPQADPEEVAAMMAAIGRFERETPPRVRVTAHEEDLWAQAAITEGIGRWESDESD